MAPRRTSAVPSARPRIPARPARGRRSHGPDPRFLGKHHVRSSSAGERKMETLQGLHDRYFRRGGAEVDPRREKALVLLPPAQRPTCAAPDWQRMGQALPRRGPAGKPRQILRHDHEPRLRTRKNAHRTRQRRPRPRDDRHFPRRQRHRPRRLTAPRRFQWRPARHERLRLPRRR